MRKRAPITAMCQRRERGSYHTAELGGGRAGRHDPGVRGRVVVSRRPADDCGAERRGEQVRGPADGSRLCWISRSSSVRRPRRGSNEAHRPSRESTMVQSTPRGAELTPEVLAALRQGPMTRTPLLKLMEQYSIQLGYQRLRVRSFAAALTALVADQRHSAIQSSDRADAGRHCVALAMSAIQLYVALNR
jgi:hypothetical protein